MYEESIGRSLTGALYNPLGDLNYQSWLQKQQTAYPQLTSQTSPIGRQLVSAAQPMLGNGVGGSNSFSNQPALGPNAVANAQEAAMSQGQQRATDTAQQTARAVGAPVAPTSRVMPATEMGDFFSHKRLGDADVEKGISLAAGLLMPGIAPTVTAAIGLGELAYAGGKWLYNKFSGSDAPGPGTPMEKSPYSNYSGWYDSYASAHPESPTTQPEGTPIGYTTGSGVTYAPQNSTPISQWHSSDTYGGYNNAGESTSDSDTA